MWAEQQVAEHRVRATPTGHRLEKHELQAGNTHVQAAAVCATRWQFNMFSFLWKET